MTMMGEKAQLEQRINKLRHIIEQDPTKYKARSKLCHLLIEYSKIIPKGGCKEEDLKLEAYENAKKCIQLVPNESIGYGALSNCSPSYKERMDALQRAMDIEEQHINHSSTSSSSTNSPHKLVGMAYAYNRLLIEPRKEEKKEIANDPVKRKKISKGSTIYPSKRDLSTKEQLLYNKMKDIFIKADESIQLQLLSTSIDNDDCNSNEIMKLSNHLGMTHYNMGIFFRKLLPESTHRSKSLYHLKRSLQFLSSNHYIIPKCQFWIATFCGEKGHDGSGVGDDDDDDFGITIDRCPEEYVISLYSTFASNFDDLLVNKLKYQTPTKLRQVVDKVKQDLFPNEKNEDNNATRRKVIGVDLGCGTGLSGLAFQDCVDDFYGVDLSPEMIAKARSRNHCYKNVYVGELETIFHQSELQNVLHDLVIACDVFVYIGELKQIFKSVYQNLQPSVGLFAFSTECVEEEVCRNKPFVLHKCARFGHKRSYIEDIAKDVGFDILYLEKSVIRRNQGKDVTGLLVVLSR